MVSAASAAWCSAPLPKISGYRDRRHQRPARARLPGLHAEIRFGPWPLQRRDFGRRQLLVVNGKKIRLTAVKDPAELKWNEVGADIVIEFDWPVPDHGKLPEAHGRRGQEGRPVRSFQGRYANVRLWREPRPSTPAKRSFPPPPARPTAWPRSPRFCTTTGASSAA